MNLVGRPSQVSDLKMVERVERAPAPIILDLICLLNSFFIIQIKFIDKITNTRGNIEELNCILNVAAILLITLL